MSGNLIHLHLPATTIGWVVRGAMGFVAPADDLLMQFKVSLNCCVSRPASIRPTRRD
uniref:Uncharacterized protein n=1 Tax=uncultured bacterium A1Q1_fos_36 TaxID=1256573 RepID=L7VSE7_9BACT|nr:hypothetical protein [uncultured bacterium A1Q1_fos_36]